MSLTIRLTFSAATAGAYPATFTAMRSAGAQALIIVSAPEFNRDAEILAALAIEAKLPAVCEWSHMAAQGCLFGYGPNQIAMLARTAFYVDRILRGSNPANLPVEQPAKVEPGINLETARALGLAIPTSILDRAD